MNPRLHKLFKKNPYLLPLFDRVKGAQIIKVKELTPRAITRWYGSIQTAEHNFQIAVYAVLKGGILHEIYEPPKPSLFGSLKELFRKKEGGQCGTLDTLLRKFSQNELIDQVVLFGYDVTNYGRFQLRVYTLPERMRVADILNEHDKGQNEIKPVAEIGIAVVRSRQQQSR